MPPRDLKRGPAERALQVLPQLYLAIPPFHEIEVIVGTDNGSLQPAECDLLWLIGSLVDRENGKDHAEKEWCFENEFRRHIRRYAETNITRSLRKLVATNCISRNNEHIGRIIKLKPEGRKILSIIAKEKAELAEAMWSQLPAKKRETIAGSLEALASIVQKAESAGRKSSKT